MESNGLVRAAEKHLCILRERQAVESEQYVRLAFTYGLEVDRIAELSGLTIERVRSILTAGAQ